MVASPITPVEVGAPTTRSNDLHRNVGVYKLCVILSERSESNCEAAPRDEAGSINGKGVFVYPIKPPAPIVDPDSALPHRFCRFAKKVRLRPSSVTQTKAAHSPLGRTPLRMTPLLFALFLRGRQWSRALFPRLCHPERAKRVELRSSAKRSAGGIYKR